MEFSGTDVEKQGDKEIDRRPTKLQVECRRWKWPHPLSCTDTWEMPLKKNDARGGVSLTF